MKTRDVDFIFKQLQRTNCVLKGDRELWKTVALAGPDTTIIGHLGLGREHLKYSTDSVDDPVALKISEALKAVKAVKNEMEFEVSGLVGGCLGCLALAFSPYHLFSLFAFN